MFSGKLTVLSLKSNPIMHFIRNPSLSTIMEEKKKIKTRMQMDIIENERM